MLKRIYTIDHDEWNSNEPFWVCPVISAWFCLFFPGELVEPCYISATYQILQPGINEYLCI